MDTLYAASGSTSLVTAILLEECEHPYALRMVPLYPDGAGDQEYAGLNPWRQVPGLATERGFLTEVLAICEYVDQHHRERALLPGDPWERIQAVRWYSCLSTAIQPYVRCLVRPQRFVGDTPEAMRALREATARHILARMTLVDRELQQRPWMAGNLLGPADVLLAVMVGWLELMRLPLAPLTTLLEHRERVRCRPAFERASQRHGIVPRIEPNGPG